jgi:tetratricopeptide (TPR) repeat protein
MKNRTLAIALGITCFGLLLRIVFFAALKSSWPGWDTPTIDALYHHLWAKQIADGNVLGGGPFFRAPLYPYFLGLLYAIFGANFSLVILLQHFLGVLAIPLVYFTARNYFAPSVAFVAALLTAINGVLIYFESQLLLDFLTVIFYLAFTWLLILAQKYSGNKYYFIAGLIAGLFAITRPNILAVLPLVCLWIIFIEAGLKKRIRHCILLLIGAMIIIFPVTLRNLIAGKDAVLIASQGGINFYIGNNAYADGCTALLPGFGHNWQYSDAEYEASVNLNRKPGQIKPSEVSSYYSDKTIKFIKSSPGMFAGLLIKKLYMFWNRFEISNNNNLYFLTSYIGLSFYPLFLFALISPLGLIGTVLCFVKGRRFWIFPILIFGYMLTVIIFFVTARFRIPVVPLLTIMAAYAGYEIFSAFRNRRFKYGIILIAAVVLIGIFAWTDFYKHHDKSMVMANYSLGNMFLKKGDYRAAGEQYRRALSQAACVPNAHLNLGVIAFYNQDTALARIEFENETEKCGPSAKAYNNLSMLSRLGKDYPKACAYADSAVHYFPNFKESYINRILTAFAMNDLPHIKTAVLEFLDIFPEDIAARYYYGQYLLQTGDIGKAENEFTYVISSANKDIVSEYDLSEIYSAALPFGYNPQKIKGKSFYRLGLIGVQKGDIDKALDCFQQAVSIMPSDPDAHLNLALAYDQKGDYRLAEIEFLTAIGIDSTNALYYYNYALTLGKISHYEQAKKMLEKTLRLDPELVQAKRVLDALKAQLGE